MFGILFIVIVSILLIVSQSLLLHNSNSYNSCSSYNIRMITTSTQNNLQRRINRENTGLYSKSNRNYNYYNNFFDEIPKSSAPSKYQKKMEVITEDFLDDAVADAVVGKDMRKNRNRNLKEVVREQEPMAKRPNVYTGKRTQEEIDQVIECLNLSYGNKSREELTDDERVGLINWDAFDAFATEKMGDYSNEQYRKNLKSWIAYHRRKGDILFKVDTWIWAHRALKRRR